MKIEKNVSIGHNIIGTGDKKVIALHSWMDDAESWNSTIPYLNIEEYTYAFMDVRGYGKSKEIKGQFNSDEIANDVFNLADTLHWDKFYLIGHSMCGLAAQKASLLDKQNRILKIVLVTPVSASGFPADKDDKDFFTSIVQNKEMSAMAYGVFTSDRLSVYWKEMRAKRHLQVTDSEAQLAYINMWTEENFYNEMVEVSKPFLVLSGKHDHIQFQISSQREAFKNFKNVEFIELENSGHFPMQETPLYLVSLIENYFSKNNSH
ncbi:alpha/beta hydrolase [Gaetbulibacter sp. M235]|uniref:alpha/beta fold hydrolase n=1 Tax=Gaetbulibacter sp. M235 TaxID=3126510 RepID=UPI00374E5057